MKLKDLVCPARPFAALAMALLPLVGGRVLAQQPTDPPSPTTRLPLAFVENRGQWDSPARFVVRRGPLTAHFAGAEWTLDLRRSAESTEACAVRLTFEGAREDARAKGERALPGRYSFFRGADPGKWRSDVPSFASIVYPAMYPGVDVRVRSEGQDLEYDLLLAPGADLDRVVVLCAGIDDIAIDADGALVLTTALGPIRQEAPKTWEVTADGKRRLVTCRYRRIDDWRYGFSAPERDDRRALVIDPGLVWSTYLGGSGLEHVRAIIADPSGDFIVTGMTQSPNFPRTAGAYQTVLKGWLDTFVTRFSANGQRLVWSTYLGGGAGETAWNIVREKSGDFVVVGTTGSSDFPTTTGAYDTTHNQSLDVFVSRLSSDGKALRYSTFLGGSKKEWARSVGLDAAGNVIVAGGTYSNDFPTTPGAYDTTYNGNGDVWVASLSLAGKGASDLLWSTYLGGSGQDGGDPNPTNLTEWDNVDIAVEPNGVTTVTGRTGSSDFPTTSGAYQTIRAGRRDFFVSRLTADGSKLPASTFVGGSNGEGTPQLALNCRGEPIVGGYTFSANFPTTLGAFSRTRNAPEDSCLFRLDRDLKKLQYSTFIGDTAFSRTDGFRAIAVDSAGTVTGAISAAAGFPTTPGAFDTTYNGGEFDVVVLRMRTDGKGRRDLHYASYLGGAGNDRPLGVVWDGISIATVGGYTTSTDFPKKNAFQSVYGGGSSDGFVTRIELLPTGTRVFGKSSPGCNGPVSIGVTEMPAVGGMDFALTCSGAPAKGAGFFVFGTAELKAGLPILGVDIWVDPLRWVTDLLPATSDDLGYAEVGLPIPPNPSLRGLQLFSQFFWPSPCGAQGFSASNALDLTIQ